MIIFGNFNIYGTHQSVQRVAPELQVERTKFSGVRGVSEILQGTGGRYLTIHTKIHNRYATSDALLAYLRVLDNLVGGNATLTIVKGPFGGLPDSYPACTFHGFDRDPSDDAGPLPDKTGLLDGNIPSWWIEGTLKFYQLTIYPRPGG